MGANAQTSVPTFTAGEVLTAANMNISARTGVPVFSNTTTRDAGFGGTGEKTLAEGQLCYLEDSNVVQYYDGAAWATVGPATSGALVRVGGGTLTTTTNTFSNVFSATYANYLVVAHGVKNSASTDTIGIRMGTTATGYYYGMLRRSFGGTDANASGSNTDAFYIGNAIQTVVTGFSVFISGPQLATETYMAAPYTQVGTTAYGGAVSGYLNNTTQYTDLTIYGTSGNLSGTVNVYGYTLS